MLDIPAPPPDVQTCDVCGGPALYALRVPDGRDEAVCLRHRSFLTDASAAGPGSEHLELRWGRWCAERRRSVEEVVEAGLRLPCEVCGSPGDLIQGARPAGDDEVRFEAVLCRACVAPTVRTPVTARWRRSGWSRSA